VRRRAAAALIAVAVGYVALQLLLVGAMRLGWDETVYVSQVARGVPAAFFSAPRARGISWLVAPVAVFTASPDLIRPYLAVLSGAGLAAGFWPWLRTRQSVAVPLAAAIFALLWPTLFYGPEVMPNLWVAFAAVTAVGWFLQAVQGPGKRGALLGVAVGIVVAALMRPPDAVWLALPLGLAAAVVPRWRRLPVLATVAGATVLGCVPWLVEAGTSYGGVAARLARASGIQGGLDPQLAVATAVRSVNGPLLCRPCNRAVPLVAVALWCGALLAVAVALGFARREHRLGSTVLPVIVGISLAAPYLFLLDYSAPRFLLPTYALLSIPVADALLAGSAVTRARHYIRVGAVAVVITGLAAYEISVLFRMNNGADRQRTGWATLVATLLEEGVRAPCTITGKDAPPIAFYAGCASAAVSGHNESTTVAHLVRLATRQPVAYVTADNHPPPRWARQWRRIDVPTPYARWAVYVSRPSR
jgi:4-amino-4-deoxy-L-arabinose transferase-like glycosyltransferase